MSEQWLQDYILLALRIDKAIHKFTDNPFVDAYYGPPEAYVFTYFYGKQLMRPWLQEADRLTVFRRFLTEQVSPSELVKESESRPMQPKGNGLWI